MLSTFKQLNVYECIKKITFFKSCQEDGEHKYKYLHIFVFVFYVCWLMIAITKALLWLKKKKKKNNNNKVLCPHLEIQSRK